MTEKEKQKQLIKKIVKDAWCCVSNVECEIKVDRPLIYIYAKTIKE